MNKIFRTVWNHHRRQIVVVNENTTSHSQATGSSETSSVERFSSKTKALVVSALASAVCACFALPAQASWITDHGGSDNRLDWIVGTEGTTTWNPLQNQEFEILQGETLNVGSTGSNHVEFSKYTLPNVTAGNRITNRGTYNIHWVGNKAQAGAENEGNFLDNYGKVNIVFDQTPNFGPDVSQANGNAIHNISAWEVYKWNMDGSDATWLKDKPAFYNREGAEFTIDVNVDATKLTADQDPLKRDKTITGFAIDGENDRAHMVAKNAGKMGIAIENAGAKTYGVWVNFDNSFINEKTGVLEIVTSFKKPASNFLNLDEYSLGLALGGSGSFQNDGTVKVDVEGSRTITAINGAGSSPLTAKFVNSAGATMIGNATTNVGGTALVVGLGANDLFENYGTLTGTALANGGVAQAIGLNNPESMINNYAGATLDLTAKSVYSPESSQKAHAEGIYLNDGEKFLNHGNATLTAIVDGAGTANVMNGWGINATDASKAGTTVSNDGTMVINYTGALGGGIKAETSQLENANQLTINVNRTDAEVIRTDVKGIYVVKGGSLLNTKDLDVVITANVDSKENFDKKFQASGGSASGIFATATDATPVFTNKGHANVQVTLKNNVDGLSSGVRGNGVYLEGNGSNSGTLDIHLDANYGTVTKDFDVFAASGFWLNGDAKRYGTPRFENTGSLNINTNFVADGIQLVEMTGPNSKGWSRGLEIHGQGTFVNNGQLKSVSTGNVITEGLGVQGGEFINNKDAEFVATSDGQYALGALISMPTASFEQVPPTVTNVNGATLTLTATAKNGTSSALYQSAGITTNAGTLLLNSTGKNARGIVLSNYETSLDQNLVPVLNNTGTLTITANSLEDGQPSSLHEVHGILLHKGEVNNSGTITTNVTGDGLVEGLKVTQTMFNNKLGGVLNINSVSNKDVYQDGIAAGVSIGANGNVVNAGELNIDMESHAHFIKGIAFLDRTSQLTNTGSISITGTNHGDGTTVVVPSLSDTKNAYGIYMNKSEQFANDGTVEIAVNSLKGVSMGIGVHDAEFTNNEHGNLNITTKAYEKQAYGIDVYGASGRSNNAGTITFDVTGGTTTSSHATGLLVSNGGFYGNTGTLDFNLHGVTSVDSNAEVLAIDLTRENTKFKNQGRIDITGRRTGDIATSGDLLGIRVNNGAVFENTDAGTISIDLGATGNNKYGNNFAVSVFNASTFGNKGTINITLDQEANNIGTLHGLMLGADAIVNNAASALIKIDVAPEDVASGHVWAINGEGASIRNYGTIETNGAIKVGSIIGSSASLDGGTVKLTGKDAVSTVATELKTGTLENAGTLTVGSKTSPSWAVNVYDLKNTGTLNAGTIFVINSLDNAGVVNVDTTQRIALSTYGKEVASGQHASIVNRESGQLTINVDADPAITSLQAYVAGIDLFGPTNQPTMTGGDFTNLGTATVSIVADRGHTYGIIADSTYESTIRNDNTLTIDVTKSASDATYGTWGIRGNHATSIINNGTLSINGDSTGDGFLQGIALYGSDTKRGSYRNDGLATITLVGNKNLDPSTATNAGAIGLNLSNSDAVNTSEMVFNVDGHRSDAIKLQNGSSLVNSGNITVNTNPSEGMDLALDMIGGSHFTNAEGASFTFNYLSDDPALASASTDGIKLLDEGTVLDNSGNIAINLKHLGERDDAILLKGLVVHTGATLNNAGTIEFSSETNKSASVIDGAMAVNGTLVNNGTVDLDVISHESDRQVWVGNGTLQNKNVLTMTALNDGTGDVVGFMHDWKSVLPEEKTLNITNERVMNLTLTAENGSAILYDMQGKERFENAVGATVNTTVSGGSAAKGWVMGDTSVLVNEGQVDLKLEGLNQNTVLAGVEALGEGVTATNNSTFSLTLAGTGASATGLKGNATGALFTNTGTLTVKNEGQFDQVAGIDWNGKFNNEGVITLDMTRASGESGAVNGLLLGDAFKFENKTNGTLKIDIASQDVAKSDVFAINGEGATIKNLGLIETNGAINVGTIYGDATSPNGGVLKLTGRESVSTVTGQLSLGRIENAGTLTVGTVHALSGPNSGTALKAYDLINTGTLNADTAWFTNTFTNEGEVNISTTTNRIALSTLGKDKSTGEHVTILNKKDGVLNISTKPNESLTADSKHVAGIDLFSSGDLQTSVGGDFINLGTTNIDVESHKGHTYGIVADSSAGGKNSTIRNDGSLTIDVAKLSDDDTTSVRGIHTLSGVSIINNGTLTINASKQDNQRLYGVVLDGSETDRNTFHNTKDMSITLTENGLPSVDKIANEGLYGLHLSYTDAVNTGNLNLNLDGYRAEGIRVRHASTFLNQGAVNVSIKPKDSALLGDVAKQGNNYALQVIEGSTFKNDVNGTITYRYENDNAQLTTAFTDGLAISGEGSEFTNLGSIDIHLKDLGERQASKWMKGILVGSMGTLTNEGNIHLTSETNRATESIDGVIAVNGQLVNRGDMIVNATSHESDRQFLVGSGHLQNQKNLTLTLINDGSGNVAGFNHDWTNCTPDLQTLHVQNEKDMNLTLKALNGTATIFDMVGQERFDNGATGVITAGVSGGAGANGWSLADTSIFANDNEINLTLTGLSDSAKLASLTMLGGEAVATNSGTMNITLAGQGAEAYGLKSTVADALFTNDGVLNIEATGTFTQASGMDWAGTVANAGEINSNVGLKIGTVTGTGTLTVTGGDVSVDQLNDQRQVILTNVGTANFGTIVMKSGSLEVNSKTTIANVTGNTSIKNLTNAGNLTLGGTLTLGASGAPGALNNTGTLTIKGHTTAVGSITNSGRFTAQDMDVQGSVYNRRTGVMQTGTLTVRGDKALTNEGEMTVADNSSVFGTLTNTGSIYLYDKSLVGEDGKIENRDELLVFGSLEVNGLLINLGTSKTQELILNGESISGTSGSFFMADRADVGAESIAQSGQVNGKRTNFGKDYWGTVTVNAVYENHDLVFAGSNDAILDQLGQGLSGTGMTVTAEGSILNQSGATLQINGALDNSGSVTGGTLALDASSQLTNRNTINVDALTGSDITITQGEAGATLTTAKNEVTNSNFILTQGNASFDTLGTGNTYQLGGHVGDSVTVDLGRLTSDSTINIGQGAELAVTTIDLDGVKANTVVLDGGTLKTSLDQIFADVAVNGAVDIDAQSSKDTVNVSGMTVATNVGAIKDAVSTGIAFNSGTVAFNDKVYSLTLATDVLNKLEADDGGNLEVVFNGRANVNQFTVDLANTIKATNDGKPAHAVFAGETLINIDKTQPDLHHSKLVVGSADPSVSDAHHLTQSMGFMNVTGVQDGLFIRGEGTEFVLVGVDANAQGVGDVHNFKLADGDVDVGTGSTLTLGSYGKTLGTEGVLGLVTNEGTVNIKNGLFTLNELTGNGTLAVSDADHAKVAATLKVGTLTQHHVNNFGSIIAETMTVDTLANAGDVKATTLTLNGKGSTSSGKIEVKTATIADAASLTLMGSWVGDTLTVDGTLSMTDKAASMDVGTLTVNTNAQVTSAGTFNVDDLVVNGHLTQSGTATHKTVTVADLAELTNNGSLTTNTLTVEGTYAGSGVLTVNTNTTVTGSLTSTGAKANLGTLTVTDATLVAKDLTSNDATVNGQSSVTVDRWTAKDVMLEGTTTVSGAFTADALTAKSELTAGATTVAGAFVQTAGNATLGSLSSGTFESNGIVNVDKTLNTSKLTQKGGELTVGGALTATAVTLDGVTTIMGGLTADSLNTSNALTAGITTLTGAFVQTAGNATLGSLSSGTFESNGIVNVDKTLNTSKLTQKGGELTVGGALTATAVTLDGVTTIKGGLTADSLNTSNALTAGITTLTGAFVQTAGNATLSSLSSGTFESNGIVNVNKTLNTTTLNQKGGELHVGGTLTATNATFNGTVESGDIHAQSVTTSGSLSASDATIEGIFDQTDGTVTLEDLTAGSVNQTTGQMTASNVTADKVTLGGKTDVAGLTAGQLTVSGTFEADVVTVTGKYDQSAGTADIGALTSESFANAGDVTVDVIDTALNNMGDLTINKTFELSGTNDGTLNADHAKGTLTDFTNNGMAQFGSTTVTDLTNNGSINFADATLNGVNVNNKDMTSNALTVAGTLTTTGTLTSQKTNVDGTLSVNGGQAQLGELGVTGTLNVAQGGVANLGATTVNKGHVNVAGGKLQVESLTQTGGSLSLTQGGSFEGKLNITGADITLGNASLNADGSIKDSNLTITGGTWGDDLTNLVSTDKGALGNNTLTMTGGTLDLGDNTLTSSGSITMTGGTLIADNIALDGKTEGVITVGGKGTLQTTLNQIFKDFVVEGVEISATNWEDAWGGVHGQVIDAATDVGDVKDSIITGIHFNGGSLTFTDEAFRTDLVAEVGSALAQTFGDGKVNVEFTGHAVDDFTLDTIHKLEQDGMADKTQGLVFAGDDLINNSGDTTLDVGKADSDDIHMNTGFAGVTNTDHINIKDDLEFVLVGKTDKDGKPLKDQLLSDATNGGSVHVENGTLTLGSNGMKDKTGGTLAEVVLDEQGNLVIKNGDFTVDRIESDGTLHVTGGGSLTSNEVTLDKGDNKIDEGGVLIVEEDEKGNGSLHIKGEGTLTNDGTLIAGGDNSHVDTTVDGTLTNNGTGVYDDMTINPDGHYHNTSTGKDKGDKIEVAEGGKWTNDGQSSWGQVDNNGSFDNTGSIVIGDGKAETDDFHVGQNGTVNQDGKLDASNAGHTIIEGNFTTGDLTEDGKPDPDAGTKFDDVTVTGGAHLENNGTEIGNNLTVDKDGEYVNNGQSQWGSVDMNGTMDNTGSIVIGDGKTETDDFHVGPDATVNQDGILDASNAGHTIIEGNFTTGDLTEDGKPDPNAGTKFDDVTVTGGAHLENNGTEIGNNLTVDKDGEYVNNGQSQWGTVDIAGKGENNGDLIIKGDGNDATGDLIIEGTGDLVNNGNLIVGGKDTNNDVIIDGTLTNNGTGVYDDMIINPDGHYNNTTTGKDQGDKIEVTEGGKWTNDGQSNWGQVDINGNASNNGDLIIGNGNDKDDDFHIGPNGSLDNQGHIDASNSGTAQIEGDLVNGTLSPDGKPDTDTSIKFDDVVVENGGKLENNGTESGDSLVVKPGGDYINNGNSNWNDVTIEDGANSSNNGKLDIENDFVVDGDFNNNGSINAGNTIIGGNFDQTDNGSLNTGDLTVRPGGNIDMDKGEINVSGDLNLNGANVVIGNWKALSQENRVSPTWSADKPIDGKIWVIGNGDLTFGTASEGFADKLQKFDKKVPGLSGAASRVTVGQTVTMGAGSSLAVGSNVWNPAKDQGRVELTEGSVYFGRDSYVLIDIGALGDGPAFTTTVEGATATVESGANLVFGNLSKTGEFTLLEGFEIEGNFDKDGNWTGGWDGEDMYIVNEDGSGLDYFITINVDKDKDRVNANVTVADIATVYPNIVLPGLGNEALKDCQSGKDSSFICSIVKNENLTVAEKTQIINSVAQIASVAGTTASAFADMGMATDVLESRLSFTGPTHKNGQLLQIPATDALWVEVIGGKSKTTSLNYTKLSGGYKSDTYGFMIGADALMPKPAVKLGGAFSYLSGSLKSVGGGLETSNSYDTYGAHLYAAWTPTTKFNLIGHMDWMHQESDVNMTIGQSGFNSASAIPKVNVAQVGVRAEVRETAGLFEIVPHVGVRGVYTKTENFKTKIDGKNAFGNELEDTFTVQLPIGLTVSGNIPANTGWTVSPKADVTFVGQVGDTEQKTVVSGTSMSATDTVSGAFAGECYGQVKMGLKLSNPKADTSFGGTVGYTRGDAGKKDLSFGVQFTKNF